MRIPFVRWTPFACSFVVVLGYCLATYLRRWALIDPESRDLDYATKAGFGYVWGGWQVAFLIATIAFGVTLGRWKRYCTADKICGGVPVLALIAFFALKFI